MVYLLYNRFDHCWLHQVLHGRQWFYIVILGYIYLVYLVVAGYTGYSCLYMVIGGCSWFIDCFLLGLAASHALVKLHMNEYMSE